MIFVDRKTREERMARCTSCEYYVAETRTCGTLLLGGEAKVGKRKVKLCGCVMPLKTKLKTSACPINKWSRQVDAETVKRLRELVEKQGSDTRMKATDAHQMFELYNKAFGTKKQFTTCPSCVKQMWEDIKQSI